MLCATVVVVCAPAAAQAQRSRALRVAVGPFAGERSAITRGMVASVFSDHVGEIELAALGDYNATADRLGVGGQGDEAAVVAVSRELHLDLVVTGALERRAGRGYRLNLRVMRGPDGTTAVTQAWDFERIDEISALGNDIWERLSPTFRPVPASGPETGASGGRTGAFPRGAGPDGSRAPTGAAAAEEAGDAPGLGFLSLRLGGGVAGRSWRVPVLGERTTRGYENGLFGELQAEAEVLYRFNHQRMGFGAGAAVGFPVGLSSVGRDVDGNPVTLTSSGLEVLAGVVFAARPSGGGMMRVSAGFAMQTFDVDTARLPREMQLAPASYLGLRIAGEGMIPFYSRNHVDFGALFGGEFRWMSAGAELRAAFGDNADPTIGLGAWFGLATRLDRFAPGLGFRATAQFTRYRTTFHGTAMLGTGSDSIDDFTRYVLSATYEFGAPRGPASGAAGRGADPYGPR